LDCARCLSIHGPGCPASHTNEDGTPICVWCEDKIPCAVQQRVMASGKNVKERAAYIETEARKHLSEIKRDHNDSVKMDARKVFFGESSSLESLQPPARSISPSAVAVARGSQEDQMSTSTTASEITTATPLSICSECGKNKLSYNNGTGTCGTCRKHSSQKTNGHNGAHPRRELQASPKRKAAPAKPNGNGAVHHDSVVHSNGNGNGAHVESRVELLLAQIPREDKAKLLAAYIAGTV
jgi:uncharacterized Zn finger protein (UPF0148 family)